MLRDLLWAQDKAASDTCSEHSSPLADMAEGVTQVQEGCPKEVAPSDSYLGVSEVTTWCQTTFWNKNLYAQWAIPIIPLPPLSLEFHDCQGYN